MSADSLPLYICLYNKIKKTFFQYEYRWVQTWNAYKLHVKCHVLLIYLLAYNMPEASWPHVYNVAWKEKQINDHLNLF